ncbi:bifunctional enoyl-CoA hydratase/phosphate acetyltransferase [Wukongibacter sp. M2B1]|uniref:bifunctional enoyl-CoA hydratase/phosphate acetyltransferase n=1 Tax=Wukongibacter sp. M2B1 TaxID=3088895 RepID=UPI003D79E0D8
MRSFEEMQKMLKTCPTKRRIAVVAAHDEHTLEAVIMAAKEGLVAPVLIGDQLKIEKILESLDCSKNLVEIINIIDPVEAALESTRMVKEGKVDCIMKGKIETGKLMKVLVDRETGIRKKDTMSLVVFVESPYYHKVFAITDAGLLTYPILEQKKEAIENAVGAFHALGIRKPKVAVLAAVEKINPKMKETIEADELKKMAEDNTITGCILEGPISYDLTMNKEAAEIKGYESPVAGDADILVVPDIVAGNLLVKSLNFTGGAKACGVILGAIVPLVITSRSSKVEDKFMAIVLSALVGKVK